MARTSGSAREQARKMQQNQERKQKSQSLLLRIGVVVVALVVVAGLSIWVLTGNGGGSNVTEGDAPAAATESGGITLTSSTELTEGASLGTVDADDTSVAEPGGVPAGIEPRAEGEPPHVVIYTDPACPACAQFESAYHDALTEWLDAGLITLEYRSLNFLSDYSTRGTNAFACMADESPENYHNFLGDLTAERLELGPDGLSNEEIINYAQENYGADISTCVENGTYRAFTAYTTNLAREEGIAGTPTIYIDDQEVQDFMGFSEPMMEAIEAYQQETGEETDGAADAPVDDEATAEDPGQSQDEQPEDGQ